MKNITILVLNNSIMGTIEGPRLLFTEVNVYLQRMGRQPLFNVQLAGIQQQTQLYNGLYAIQPNVLLQDVAATDLIIIPALDGDLQLGIQENQAFVPWIKKQYKAGAEVASLCLGAF